MKLTSQISITDVTADNVDEHGVYCVVNKKSRGYHAKIDWCKSKVNEELKLKIAFDQQGKQQGFIEYLPSENAWRPVKAKNYVFIQCIVVFSKALRNQHLGSMLLEACEEDARQNGKDGVCSMTSDGTWMANKKLFEKNGFTVEQKQDRFELMVKKFNRKVPTPELTDWTSQLPKYKGWNLIYADQCPWHCKSVEALLNHSYDVGIDLKVQKLETPKQAQNAPSGYGTFALIKDGRLLADHYISKTRFANILKEEAN